MASAVVSDPVNGVEESLRTDQSSVAAESLINADGTPTPRGWRKIGELLRKPMQTRERKGPGGRMLAYITARDVQNRLDGVVGPGNWRTSFRVLSQEPWVVECTLTVCGASRADVGYSNAPDSEDEMEPAKAAYSGRAEKSSRWIRNRTLVVRGLTGFP